MVFLIAFDPGKTTGWAQFDRDGNVQMFGQFSTKELDEWAIQCKPGDFEVVVYEKYIIYPSRKHININVGRKNSPADEAIGVILLGARRANAKIVGQQANIKETAQKWSGMSPDKVSHSSSHQIDAINHGVYYLVYNKLIPNPALQRAKKKL